jgi:hypothetical protein
MTFSTHAMIVTPYPFIVKFYLVVFLQQNQIKTHYENHTSQVLTLGYN